MNKKLLHISEETGYNVYFGQSMFENSFKLYCNVAYSFKGSSMIYKISVEYYKITSKLSYINYGSE